MNHRTNFLLSAGLTVAVLALAAGSASAAGGEMAMRENVGTRVQGISPKPTITGLKLQPRPTVQGIMLPGKVTGLKPVGLKPPVIGIIKPPVVTGIIKPPIVTGIIKPPKGIIITGIVKPPKVVGIWPPVIVNPPVVVNPPAVVTVPGETTYKRRYTWYTGGAMATANTAVSAAPAPCNCLTKEYLQDGSVLFKDLCTKESAVATVEEMKARM